MKNLIWMMALLLLTGWCSALEISASEVINDWSVANNPKSNTSGSWSLSGSEVLGPDSGMLLSDFSLSGDASFSGSFRNTGGDDDIVGLVFGYQDNSNHYRFSWDAFDVNSGFGDSGTNGVNNASGIGGVHGIRFFKTVGGSNSFLFQDPGPNGARRYVRSRLYDFSIVRTGSQLQFTLSENVSGTTLVNQVFNDSTFTSGQVGIFTASQSGVFFSNLAVNEGTVPEPASIAFLAMAMGAFLLRRRR